MTLTCAVIGAGLAGLTAANILAKSFKVSVFDKARGVGGRLSTRYQDNYQFDHGAQYFRAYTDAFKTALDPLIKEGIVQPWQARCARLKGGTIIDTVQWDSKTPHYVAVPKMNQLAKSLCTDFAIKLNTPIQSIQPAANNQWQLFDKTGQSVGHFDWVIISAPAPQTEQLMPEQFMHYDVLKDIRLSGCFSLMLGLRKPLALAWESAFVEDCILGFIAANHSKPGRPNGYSLVVQSTNAWADDNIEKPLEHIKHQLIEKLAEQLQQPLSNIVSNIDYCQLHRWRYAHITQQETPTALLDYDNRLAACGDWCIKGRVEAAFTSGNFLANQLLEHIRT